MVDAPIIPELENLMQLGKFEDARKLMPELGLNKSIEQLYNFQINFYLGNYEKAVSILPIDGLEPLAEFRKLVIKGRIAWSSGDLNQLREVMNLSNKYFTEFHSHEQAHWEIAQIHHLNGLIAAQNGDLDSSLRHFNNALNNRMKINAYLDMIQTLNNIGAAYTNLGMHPQAIESYQKAVDMIEQHQISKQWAIVSIMNLGTSYLELGQYSKAIQHLYNSLDLAKNTTHVLYITYSYMELAKASLALQNIDTAQKMLDNLEKHHLRHPDNYKTEIYYKMLKGLLLIHGDRMTEKARGMEILRDVIANQALEFRNKVLATKYYCRMLVAELKTFGSSSALHELESHINQLHMYGQKLHSRALVIETLLIRGELSLIAGKFDEVERIYDQAELMALEGKLVNLEIEVKSRRDRFKNELEHWRTIIDRNAPLVEKINMSMIMDYLQDLTPAK